MIIEKEKLLFICYSFYFYLLFFLYIGAYANFFVEPIWEGQLNFFLAMCVIDGMVNAMIRGLPYESDSGESISPASGLR